MKNIENPLGLGILNGVLEITSGIKKLSLLEGYEYIVLLPIVALILGFGGFSVHMQVASIIAESKLSMKPYLIGKLLQGVFAGIYTYFILKYTSFFSLELVTAFSYHSSKIPVIDESFNLFRTVASLFFVSLIMGIVYLLRKKQSD